MSCRRVAPTTRQSPISRRRSTMAVNIVLATASDATSSATMAPPSITPRRNASARSSCASVSAGRHDREPGHLLPDAVRELLGILAVLPEHGRGGGDGEDLGARHHGEPSQDRLAVEEQPLGRGERHHHEAVGAGQRLLEDADDVEVAPADPDGRPDVRVEPLRHLAADHDLVAPRCGHEAAGSHAWRGRTPIAREQLLVDAEGQRRQREGQAPGSRRAET